MMSSRIESCLNKIKENTQNFKIKWKPISDYIKYYDDNNQISEKISMMYVNEYIDIQEDESFFAKKDDSYIFVLSYTEVSSISGECSTECELIVIPHKNADIFKIPPYIDGGIEVIRESIKQYLNIREDIQPVEFFDVLNVLEEFGS